MTQTNEAMMSEAKLQIREGLYYRNRKGEKIGPIERNVEMGNYPWTCGLESFTNSGPVYLNLNTDRDLISEWTDPAPQVPAVDLQAHELAELRKANAEMGEQLNQACARYKRNQNTLVAERDELHMQIEEVRKLLHVPPECNLVHFCSGMADGMKATKRAIDDLRKQLAEAKRQPEWAWRDARPEDAGKGYPAVFGDRPITHKALVEHAQDSGMFQWVSSGRTRWTFCQVYAPVEAQQPPATPAPVVVDEWRDAELKDCGRGDLAVSDDGLVWSNANRFLLSIENIDGERRFLIRSNKQKHHGMQFHFYAYKFARVRKAGEVNHE